jgi:hypothetical protein
MHIHVYLEVKEVFEAIKESKTTLEPAQIFRFTLTFFGTFFAGISSLLCSDMGGLL